MNYLDSLKANALVVNGLNLNTAAADVDYDITPSVSGIESLDVQVEWSGLNAANGTVKVFQRMSPEMTFVQKDAVNHSVTMAAASGNTILNLGLTNCSQFRIRVSKVGNTAGSVKIAYGVRG